VECGGGFGLCGGGAAAAGRTQEGTNKEKKEKQNKPTNECVCGFVSVFLFFNVWRSFYRSVLGLGILFLVVVNTCVRDLFYYFFLFSTRRRKKQGLH